MAAYLSIRKRLASCRPPSTPSIHEIPTLRQPLNPVLLAEMCAGHAATLDEQKKTVKRRRYDADRETLDRANPFLTPSPDAPWAPKLLEKRDMPDLLGVVVAVWSVVVALVLFVFAVR
ncbi:MAG TPA: hypothetical protein VIF62_04455 [Labilithrix sp.]|jgi:hypothetical protein